MPSCILDGRMDHDRQCLKEDSLIAGGIIEQRCGLNLRFDFFQNSQQSFPDDLRVIRHDPSLTVKRFLIEMADKETR